jgi:Putative transposase of IS4/5 family (DUF4096)
MLSGIIFINHNGLRWCEAPAEYGPHETPHNRWARWSRLGVFAQDINPLRPPRRPVPVSLHPRRNGHVLAMSPDEEIEHRKEQVMKIQLLGCNGGDRSRRYGLVLSRFVQDL